MGWITLQNGERAQVDDADVEWLSRWKWYRYREHYPVRRTGTASKTSRCETVYMHRVITDAPKGSCVDHINGDVLDNRRCNLRIVSVSENNRNIHRLNARNTSGHIGVYWIKKSRKWGAYIRLHNHMNFLGSYESIDDAIAARKQAEKRLWGAELPPLQKNGEPLR